MFAGLLLGLAGTAVQMAGQSAAMGAQSASAAYQAQVAKMNEKIAKQNANITMQSGLDEQYHKGMETRALIGTQKAAQAANGIDVTTGSAKGVRDSTYILGRMDEMTIMRNASHKADAYMAQAANYSADAELYNFQAKSADSAKDYAMLSTLIGGATSFASKWQSLSQAGAFG